MFIPASERTDLQQRVDSWVINTAAKQAFQCRQEGHEIPIAINLSPRSFIDPNLVSTVDSLKSLWGLGVKSIELEVTETALMADPEQSSEVCEKLHELDIDVFGTGQSSMAYLRDLSVSQVKIDQSFVMQMSSDTKNAAIIRSVIDLGNSLNKTMISEGVEDDSTAMALKELGCQIAQGWNYSKAKPAYEWPRWLEKCPVQSANN